MPLSSQLNILSGLSKKLNTNLLEVYTDSNRSKNVSSFSWVIAKIDNEIKLLNQPEYNLSFKFLYLPMLYDVV